MFARIRSFVARVRGDDTKASTPANEDDSATSEPAGSADGDGAADEAYDDRIQGSGEPILDEVYGHPDATREVRKIQEQADAIERGETDPE